MSRDDHSDLRLLKVLPNRPHREPKAHAKQVLVPLWLPVTRALEQREILAS